MLGLVMSRRSWDMYEMTKATLKGLTIALALITVPTADTYSASAATLRAPNAQLNIDSGSETLSIQPVVQVQGSGNLVPKSVAARAARRYSGGQVLGIRLRLGNRPVYIVKVKTSGKIRRVRVDARNGRVLGRP